MNAAHHDVQVELPLDAPKRSRRRRIADTSRVAKARSETTHTQELRAQIRATIAAAARDPERGGATADEIHEALAFTEYQRNNYRLLMEVRRRVSDLHGKKFMQIEDSGIRRNNGDGNPMIVWRPRPGAGPIA